MNGNVLRVMAQSEFFRFAYATCRQVPLLGPSLHRIALRVLPRGTRVWIRIPCGEGKGLWFYADLRFEQGYCRGDYEPWLQEFLGETLAEGDCFYDVGAHTGFSALIAARFVGERGVVLALEPDPRNAAVLRANVARNEMPQVKVIEAAAWSASGEVAFRQDHEASNCSQGRVVLTETAGSQDMKVHAVSLDDLVFSQHERPPDLIKLDAEGGEGEALKGAGRTLREVKPALLCEVHDPDMLNQLRASLAEFSYSLKYWTQVDPHYPDIQRQYLCAKGRRG